jgi:RimJ/RimL family protein N-acetyltransferase
MLDLRPATIEDSDLLFDWRNDPVTRAFSRSTAIIPREDHDRWMQFNVLQGYPTHLVMIAETENGPVGVVRFDADKGDVMSFRVSITIAPYHRRTGLGFAILAEACRYMGEYTLSAEIRYENDASIKIFERCGFKMVGKDAAEAFENFRREPLA